MDWLFILFVVALGLADWIGRNRAEVATATRAAQAARAELDAVKWARTVEDTDAEAESLRDAILAEDNREAAAWNEFRGKWKPGPWLRFRSWQERRSYVQPDPWQHARRDFLKRFTSQAPALRVKLEALRVENHFRHRAPVSGVCVESVQSVNPAENDHPQCLENRRLPDAS